MTAKGKSMSLNRELQYFILKLLEKSYPYARTDVAVFTELEAFSPDVGRDEVIANLVYLEEHELIRSGLVLSMPHHYQFSREGMRISHKGMDFLKEDGGLSAILNCVTVRIHDETLARIASFLEQSPLPAPQKKAYLEKLRELPFETTRHLVCRLLDLALEKTPDALQLIQTLMS